jgi:V/A-type H+-transporting ATPase subunit B
MQLYASYARVKEVRAIASIVGEEELGPIDKMYLEFGDEFEHFFIGQGFNESRSMEESLGLGWKMVSMLPKSELSGLREEEIIKYYSGEEK